MSNFWNKEQSFSLHFQFMTYIVFGGTLNLAQSIIHFRLRALLEMYQNRRPVSSKRLSAIAFADGS